MPTDKEFGFSLVKNFPTMLHAINQCIEVITTSDRSHSLIHQSNLHAPSESTISLEIRIKVLRSFLRNHCLFLIDNIFMKRQHIGPFSALGSQHLNLKTLIRLIIVDHKDLMCNSLTQNGSTLVLFTNCELFMFKDTRIMD